MLARLTALTQTGICFFVSRRIMTLNKSLTVFYIIGFIHQMVTIIYSLFCLDFSKVTDEKILDMKVHSLRYLTGWNVFLQANFYVIALLCEFTSAYSKKTDSNNKNVIYLKVLKGIFFSSLVFPCTIVVFTVFWTLYLINPDYTLPPGSYEVLPSWLNHFMHTNIILLPIIEIVFGELFLPKPIVIYGISFGYSLIYSIQFVAFHFETGRWLYGIFYVLTPFNQGLLIVMIVVYFLVLDFIGIQLINRKSNKFEVLDDDKEQLNCLAKIL